MPNRSTLRGPNNPRWKGGTINRNGYRVLYLNGKRVLEHRDLMAKHLGRPLLRSEVVHHKDGNPINNDISNLELVPSQSEHVALHFTRYRTETHKQCKRCLAVKPRTDFHVNYLPGRDPSEPVCKACRKAYYARKWRGQHPRSRKLTWVIYNGESTPLAEVSRVSGVPHGCLTMRLKRGWTIEEATRTPVRPLAFVTS